MLAVFVWMSGAVAASAQTELSCPEMGKALQDLMRNDLRMRDWAQLSRYRAANVELAQQGATVEVAFLGDSITDGWDDAPERGFFPGKNYLNRGISGQTTPQMLIRLKPDVLVFKPRVLVLLAGTNDIAGNTGPMTDEDIQHNIAAIAELSSAQGVRVVLASILPVSNYHVQPGSVPQTERRPLARINALNAWLREYARTHKHIYLDYFTAMADASGMLKEELSEDDLHPNGKGYAVMTPLAEAAIADASK